MSSSKAPKHSPQTSENNTPGKSYWGAIGPRNIIEEARQKRTKRVFEGKMAGSNVRTEGTWSHACYVHVWTNVPVGVELSCVSGLSNGGRFESVATVAGSKSAAFTSVFT